MRGRAGKYRAPAHLESSSHHDILVSASSPTISAVYRLGWAGVTDWWRVCRVCPWPGLANICKYCTAQAASPAHDGHVWAETYQHNCSSTVLVTNAIRRSYWWAQLFNESPAWGVYSGSESQTQISVTHSKPLSSITGFTNNTFAFFECCGLFSYQDIKPDMTPAPPPTNRQLLDCVTVCQVFGH